MKNDTLQQKKRDKQKYEMHWKYERNENIRTWYQYLYKQLHVLITESESSLLELVNKVIKESNIHGSELTTTIQKPWYQMNQTYQNAVSM